MCFLASKLILIDASFGQILMPPGNMEQSERGAGAVGTAWKRVKGLVTEPV